MASAAAVPSGAGSCERSRGEKRRVSDAASAGEGRDQGRGHSLLLPALMEAARLLQYKSQYRRSSGRAAGLRASLRVTCEAYLKLVNASQFTRDRGALRLIRLLTETHVQAQARAMAKLPSRSEPRSMELRSMVQLAELIAREYVAEMKGEMVLYTPPIPVDVFRPVKRRCVGEIPAEDVALRGMLSHVAERSAFTSVPPRDTDSDCSVVSGSEKFEDDYVEHSDGIVPESGLDEYEEYDDDDCDDHGEYDEYDECRADGSNLAQCICNKCFLGDKGGE